MFKRHILFLIILAFIIQSTGMSYALRIPATEKGTYVIDELAERLGPPDSEGNVPKASSAGIREEKLVLQHRERFGVDATVKYVLSNIDTLVKGVAFKAEEIMSNVLKEEDIGVERKDDKSVVTKADKEIQKLVDRVLKVFLPESVIIGEESYSKKVIGEAKKSRFVWVVDPLDNTESYRIGGNNYSFAIILLENGSPVYSLIYAPEFNVDGNNFSLLESSRNKEGAYLNGRRVFINDSISALAEATILMHESSKFPSPQYYDTVKQKAKKVISSQAGFVTVMKIAGSKLRSNNEVSYLRPFAHIWDMIQAIFLIQELGGVATYDNGSSIFPFDFEKLDFAKTDSPRMLPVILGTQGVHKECLELSASSKSTGTKTFSAGGLDDWTQKLLRRQRISLQSALNSTGITFSRLHSDFRIMTFDGNAFKVFFKNGCLGIYDKSGFNSYLWVEKVSSFDFSRDGESVSVTITDGTTKHFAQAPGAMGKFAELGPKVTSAPLPFPSHVTSIAIKTAA